MKYWSDCSKQEKKEYAELKDEIGFNKFYYLRNLIDKRTYSQRKRRLLEKINNLERKYDESNTNI